MICPLIACSVLPLILGLRNTLSYALNRLSTMTLFCSSFRFWHSWNTYLLTSLKCRGVKALIASSLEAIKALTILLASLICSSFDKPLSFIDISSFLAM